MNVMHGKLIVIHGHHRGRNKMVVRNSHYTQLSFCLTWDFNHTGRLLDIHRYVKVHGWFKFEISVQNKVT